ncbi:septal ring lytic transglycosylase RlpA family protein [Halomonas saccharevitans]|uniref:Endolytic peptidoglycan transglycosylase RlpA n=1 Tax=Halomonas saccharevitans TaxID=416872 RepID=A0ABU3NBA4_9GAMM|nr:septal ring lytic transglycosylase RlpA family protein [Halomonas saccharevitans]MDT8878480.1 septal ring lytic transglycosylase RlpA family protein [Halomonas saccharevitans]
MRRFLVILSLASLLVGCAGPRPAPVQSAGSDASASASSQGGERYALTGDAYPEDPPDVAQVPDAVPQREPRSRGGNKSPYEVWGKRYEVMADASGYRREGRASWYGEKFHGYATSNGEIYDMYKMSAAHRSLPLPSFVRVTSLDNGRSTIVRVNDRGPFHSEREIDLSYAAAARLGILEQGTGRVRVEAIDVERWLARRGGEPEPDPTVTEAGDSDAPQAVRDEPAEGVFLQVAALGSEDGALALQAKLEAEIAGSVRVASAEGLHRVQVGPLDPAGQLDPVREQLRRAGFAQAFIVDDAD